MKVIANKTTRQIYSLVEDTGEVKIDLLQIKDYIILDIEDAVSSYIEYDEGIIPVFRELTGVELAPYLNIESKKARAVAVENIEVEYNGVIYQGDETSQDRMSRAINGLPDDVTVIYWKAKDNSSQELTRLDLKEILFLAGQEQTRIWFN